MELYCVLGGLDVRCDMVVYCSVVYIAEASLPLSVELSKFLLYLFKHVYIYIFIYFRPYIVHVPLMRNVQTSYRPVEVQKSI